MKRLVHQLADNQAQAVDPRESVWLSASAGTGKTQVLSARVLRLLLQPDVHPSQVLCLTFTKAGAAEMAVRVNEVLASWVRMKAGPLAVDLKAIGADFDPASQERARTLFASVLDCPGGGLRINTIHAFAQWLLSAFPEEAGLTPGTRAMEDRDRDLLARDVLSDMLLDAQVLGDGEMLDALADLSLRMGPDGVQGWLMRCAAARELWFGPGAWMPPLAGPVRRLLGLPEDADEASLAALCADEVFDIEALRLCLETLSQWNAATGRDGASAINQWLALDAVGRLTRLDLFTGTVFNKDGSPKQLANILKRDAAYTDHVGRVQASIAIVRERQIMLDLARWLTPALELGRRFALAWDEAKAREGLIDFDDQIAHAAALLGQSDLSEWIRYKLDRRIDHILIDEAQDTNRSQWDIIFALIGDYFAGEGAADGKLRTVFTVGDYKQAIFRFQGTSPENFENARQLVKTSMAVAAANARGLRSNHRLRELSELGLDRSYRTGKQVLDFVDAAIARIDWTTFGLKTAPEPHVGEDRPGLVTLWQPVAADNGEQDRGEQDRGDEGGANWLSRPDRMLADRIARQVRRWMDDGFPLIKGAKPGQPPRRAGPGDVMVLVRKRKELAGLIVARLYAAGVPVAGVDRLRLGAPLAVKDLVSALRFAAQPLDDLTLANLLVSPLVGWSQQQLLDHGWRPKNVALWEHLRTSADPDVRATLAMLGDLLALADFEPPQALLHWMLVGPWQGRSRLVARLGREANDPIDELLNAAMAYASAHTPSLQGFLQWFDAGDGELKREAGSGDGLVQVMTVHGSKGLQAPIVILADAAGDPRSSPTRGLVLEEPDRGAAFHRHAVPIPDLPAAGRVGRLAEAHARITAEEMEEHWRLLYVAMTRAEEALFIAGSLGKREDVPAPDSWYARLAPLFPGDALEDDIWGERREIGSLMDLYAPPMAQSERAARVALPAWALAPVGQEPRPPRPLAPSLAGEDEAPDPPLPLGVGGDAARRGTLIHALLERLPELAAELRSDAARRWLARQAGDMAESAREEMIASVMGVLKMPEWSEIFSTRALAEVPLAATVEGQVIAGTIDRLLVTRDRVLVVDFKTARRPPERVEDMPVATLRQMAAYVAALAVIYPGRSVEAAVLYTHAPRLIALPTEALAPHKPVLRG